MPRTRPGRIEGQFIGHRLELIESPSWRGLGIVERRLIDRLEIEHMAHGGKENGQLVVTYDDFADFGIRRKSVSSGLRRLVDLGLIKIEEPGRGGNAEWRRATRYRLTYLTTPTGRNGKYVAATDDWRRQASETTGTLLKSVLKLSRSRASVQRGQAGQIASGEFVPVVPRPLQPERGVPPVDIDSGGESAPNDSRGESAPETPIS